MAFAVVAAPSAAADAPSLANRLGGASSAYLLAHRDDPVAWQPWSVEAFDLAARLGRPVFLSIGYFSCHWCHVLQEESFRDPEIARRLNESYVPVLVDREQRPEIDAVYQRAVAEFTGAGGWPLNLWLTAEREPFFAAHYLPAADGERGFETGLRTLLGRLATVWADDPGAVRSAAARYTELVRANAQRQPPAGLPEPSAVADALRRVVASADPERGGTREAPEFPLGLPLSWLLREGGEPGRAIVARTLERMAAGGVHDAVGGGFFRYALEPGWGRPHFEKLLGDQARVAAVYLEASRRLSRADFAEVARGTLDFVDREMSRRDGGFAASFDADSAAPGGGRCEGCYYTWTASEIDRELSGGETRVLWSSFRLEPLGDPAGRSVLVRRYGGVAGPQVDRVLSRLRLARAHRAAPARDQRRIPAWNGLAIGTFARAAALLQEPRYQELAVRAATSALAARSGRKGADAAPEVLDDLTALAAGLLDLYEATGEAKWFGAALDLVREIERGYPDSAGGGYFLTRADADVPLLRPRSEEDGPLPAGTSLQAMNLLRIAAWTGDDTYRQRAIAVLRATARDLVATPLARGDLALALHFLRAEPLEVVLVAPRDVGELSELRARLESSDTPEHVLSLTTAGRAGIDAELIPLLDGKRSIGGRPTAYVCRRQVCERPTTDPAELERQLVELARR